MTELKAAGADARERAAKFRVDEVVRRNGELFQIQMIHRRSDGVFLYYLDGDRIGKKLFGGVWIEEDELRPLTAREKGMPMMDAKRRAKRESEK